MAGLPQTPFGPDFFADEEFDVAGFDDYGEYEYDEDDDARRRRRKIKEGGYQEWPPQQHPHHFPPSNGESNLAISEQGDPPSPPDTPLFVDGPRYQPFPPGGARSTSLVGDRQFVGSGLDAPRGLPPRPRSLVQRARGVVSRTWDNLVEKLPKLGKIRRIWNV